MIYIYFDTYSLKGSQKYMSMSKAIFGEKNNTHIASW